MLAPHPQSRAVLPIAALMLISCSALGAPPTAMSPVKFARNSADAGQYQPLFKTLKPMHLKFFLIAEVPEKPVSLRTRIYTEHGVTVRAGTEATSAVNQAFVFFFDWAEERGYALQKNRRDHRGMSLYLLKDSTIHDPEIMHFSTQKEDGKLTRVYGLYDAWNSNNGDNSLMINHKPGRTRAELNSTIAHEMGHFLGDYFRVVDNYFVDPDATVDMEGLAYDFQAYCSERFAEAPGG
jgi:hypothetical protein